ncbi:A24 family peptidase [Botrimarina sp.]|uniref:prepilin peptidase n=1 Tax=Botrimarina sp. TaxID=2795802 RepID=UPI0032F07EB6
MLSLIVVFAVAAVAASLANAAAYELAWNRRRVSPWQPTPEGVARRTALDRVPVLGWLRLRRDAGVLGRGFWLRPMLVELAFAAAMAALYWWEVWPAKALVVQQPLASLPAEGYSGLRAFAAHFVLAWLMLAASLIDVDEKTIPDEITVRGTLLALVLMTAMPMAALPNVEERAAAPAVGVALRGFKGDLTPGPNGAPVYAEPTHAVAPGEWPDSLAGGPRNQSSLAIGLGCYVLWCFALSTRVWRTRRGVLRGLGLLLTRSLRDLRSRPLREMLVVGVLLISMVWLAGGPAWQGLLTALVGMIGAGSIVWAVRIVGTAALGREAMGFGDVTLMMMIGAFLGWQAGLLIFFLAPFAALLVGVSQVVLRRGDEVPYGPFLCMAAAVLVVQWGVVWPRCEVIFGLGPVVPIVLVVCLAVLGVLLVLWRWFKVRVLGISEDWDDEPVAA